MARPKKYQEDGSDMKPQNTYPETWHPLHHKCDTCIHFLRHSDIFESGECHRNPPFIHFDATTNTSVTLFPKVSNSNFCGEHKETEKAKKLRYDGI